MFSELRRVRRNEEAWRNMFSRPQRMRRSGEAWRNMFSRPQGVTRRGEAMRNMFSIPHMMKRSWMSDSCQVLLGVCILVTARFSCVSAGCNTVLIHQAKHIVSFSSMFSPN